MQRGAGSTTPDPRITLAGALPWATAVLGLLGLAGLSLGFGLGWARHDALRAFLHSYLMNYCYFLSISLGALFFVALQHVTRAGWSVTVRRLAELLAGNMPVLAILFLPILAAVVQGSSSLYPWAHHDPVAGIASLSLAPGASDELLRQKAAYLSAPFFAVRCVLYFAVWALLARFFLTRSLQQDRSRDVELTRRMERLSPVALLLLALTITFASIDWLMSLEPQWFSTIYGLYYFSGAVVGFLAVLILMAMLLQATGRLGVSGISALRDSGIKEDSAPAAKSLNPQTPKSFITVEHYHDLGKLLFGFVVFWGYIAFSQYLLIWYANIPEETTWYLARQSGPWKWVALVLLFGHLLVPFFGLLSREVKRRRLLLGFWAVWLLVAHWIDLYWLVMPSLGPGELPFSAVDAACLLGIGGVYFAGVLLTTGSRALVPLGDPRLRESLAFRNT
jgi:hypothetical protein